MTRSAQGAERYACRRALVVGGGSGIGRAVAELLGQKGVTVAVADVAEDRASHVARGIGQRGGTASAHRVDVSDVRAVARLFAALRGQWTALDLLVNCFGILGETAFIEDLEDAAWDRMLAVNLTGVFYCCREGVRWMKEHHGGRIVNFGSVAALMPTPGALHYSTSKAGVVQLSKTLAREVARYNIRVNVVAPGYVETPMLEAMNEDFRQQILRRTPLKRFASPEEIAALVHYLACPEADFFTGQVLSPNGGLVIA